MPRGGYHEHAERWGRKSGWVSASVTKTIRVPKDLADEVLEIAHKLDEGVVIDSETKATSDWEDEIKLMGAELNHLKAKQDQLDLALDLKKENSKLRSQLDDQVRESGKWENTAKELKEELKRLKNQSVPAADPAAITLLQNAITPKAKGGSYVFNNATGLKKLVEEALKLLS